MTLDRSTTAAALLVLAPWLALSARDAGTIRLHERAREGVGGIAAIAGALTRHLHEQRGPAAHRCPLGEAGPTPPPELRCERGLRGRCRPRASPRGPAEYASAAWHDDPIWRALGFELREPHRFRYSLSSRPSGDGCELTIRASAAISDDHSAKIEARGRLSDLGLRLTTTWSIDQVHDAP